MPVGRAGMECGGKNSSCIWEGTVELATRSSWSPPLHFLPYPLYTQPEWGSKWVEHLNAAVQLESQRVSINLVHSAYFWVKQEHVALCLVSRPKVGFLLNCDGKGLSMARAFNWVSLINGLCEFYYIVLDGPRICVILQFWKSVSDNLCYVVITVWICNKGRARISLLTRGIQSSKSLCQSCDPCQ